jgi:hypothetical protein
MTADECAAMRRDPHYRRFVATLATMVYDQAEREGALLERWRRPGSVRVRAAQEREEEVGAA